MRFTVAFKRSLSVGQPANDCSPYPLYALASSVSGSDMKLDSRQNGGALLVAMVMIFMLSVMGVSVMRSSTLEKKMTINAIQSSATFQAAESASNLALNNPDNLSLVHTAGLDTRVVLQIDEVNTGIGLESRSTLEYVGRRAAEGFSLGEGSSNFESLLFIAKGVSAIDATRSQSNVEQGAFRIVPGEP